MLIFCACVKEPGTKPSVQDGQVVGKAPSRQATERRASTAEFSEGLYPSHWQYFSRSADGSDIELKSSDTVLEIPEVAFKPWTEALRVSDFCIHNREPFFLINKCGAYAASALQSGAVLSSGKVLYSDLTVGDLYTVNSQLFVRVYQNATFLSQGAENTHFLVRAVLNSSAGEFCADVTNLHFPSQAQCKSLESVQDRWYASFKTDNGEQVSFFYITCDAFENFMQKDAYKQIKQLSAQAFRESCAPSSYKDMPKMLKVLADTVTEHTALYFKVCSDYTPHSRLFFQSVEQGAHSITDNVPHSVYALHYTNNDGDFAAILLPNGTLLLNTKSRGIVKTQLPSLPVNFRYTAFFISDTTVTAAWEESTFYQVGRAGFFSAALTELGL